jgi:hypothetical protein
MVMEPIRTLTFQIIGTSLLLFTIYIICKLVHYFRFNLGRRFRWLIFLPIIGNYFIKRQHSYVFVPPRSMRHPTLPPRTHIDPESNKINEELDSSDDVDSEEIDLNVNSTDLPIPYATAPTYPQKQLHELRRLT